MRRGQGMKLAMRIIGVALLVLAALLALMAWRAVNLESARLDVPQPAAPSYDADAIAERLGAAIRIKTISLVEGRESADPETFRAFRTWLARTYPAFHGAAALETVNEHTLVYRWPGQDATRGAIAFLAHQDVVPVEAGSEAAWTQPPFSGAVADGYVWGRGALDMKTVLVTLMEAAERLARDGFRPDRDVYFFFGHDEEVGGGQGMQAIAGLMRERGIRLDWTLDEGSIVANGPAFLGIEPDIALISTAEKGYVTLELTARDPGGHSSLPRDQTAVSKLAKAVATLTDNQFPARIDGQMVSLLRAVAAESDFTQKMAIANLWLTGPLVRRMLLTDTTMAASMRTTTAPTMISGGTAENILPEEARAIVNFRVHPADTVEEVVARVRRLVGEEIDVAFAGATGGSSPSSRSSIDGEGYLTIRQAIGDAFGPVVVAPSLTVGGTDSKHLEGVAENIYRFAPILLTPDDLSGIHGTNERIAVDQLGRMATFYERVLRIGAGPVE